MRRELWTVSGAMCEIYLQTKTLISSLGSDYKASDNGDGVRVECHRYIYHRIMDTIMSPSKSWGRDVQCCYRNEGPIFLVPRNAIWWVVIIKLTFGKHASKGNQSTEFTIAEQSRKWAILRGFYWAVNEASGPEIKYQPAFYFRAQVTNMWWVKNQVWMSGGCQDDVSLYWSLCQLRLTAA